MKTINPYLNFDGKCEEAFNFYKSVFGGEFLTLQRFKDAPSEEGTCNVDESKKEKIMHVSLPMGNETVLMGSDSPEAEGKTKFGDNISISIQAESEEEATKLFNGISDGGKVIMPLTKTFWNAYFGMCTDKFGINWMINYDYNNS